MRLTFLLLFINNAATFVTIHCKHFAILIEAVNDEFADLSHMHFALECFYYNGEF